MTTEHLPSHLQQRADAEFGAAYRRAIAAAVTPGRESLVLSHTLGTSNFWAYLSENPLDAQVADNPAEALTRLAVLLESR